MVHLKYMEEICEYCGTEIPTELLNTTNIDEAIYCQNCGVEIRNERHETIEDENRNNDINQTNGVFPRVYKRLRNRKSPIERVFKDSDFPVRFKDNFKIVVARLVFPHIRSLEYETTQIRGELELNQETIDDLYEKINPVMDHQVRVKDKFIINLYNMREKEFDKWLKILQKKIKVNNRYSHDFVLYLRWLIREVFIIVTELWDDPELPRFEGVIRDDLKAFESNLTSYVRFYNTMGLNASTRGRTRYRNPPRHIDLNSYIRPILDKYLKSIKSRQKQLKLNVNQNFITLRTRKMIDIYINRGLYDYVGTVYRIIEKSTGKMLYGFTLDPLSVRWQNYKDFSLKNRDSGSLLPIERVIVNAIEMGKNPDDTFLVKPVEICFDYNTLRIREDYWINKHDTRNPNKGFNSYRGGGGGPKIHLPIGIIVGYVAKGFKATKISKLLLDEHNILVGRRTVSRRINEYWGGLFDARRRFLRPVLEELIKTGYNSNDIVKAFGKKGRNIVDRLIPSIFGVDSFNKARGIYLLRIIEKLVIEGLGPVAMARRLEYFGEAEIVNRIAEEWGSLKQAQEILWRPIIIQSFRDGMSGPDILLSLGYKETTAKKKHNQIFTRLFWGMKTEDVRIFANSFRLGIKDYSQR